MQALKVKAMASSKFMPWLKARVKGKQNIFSFKNCSMMFAHRELMMMEEQLNLAEIEGFKMEEYILPLMNI